MDNIQNNIRMECRVGSVLFLRAEEKNLRLLNKIAAGIRAFRNDNIW
jgi:hypothetical protein